jgi:centromere protein J
MPVANGQDAADPEFEAALVNAKLAELEAEVTRFKEENASLAAGRRRLQAARKKLAEEVEEFEARRREERKAAEEERRRLKRDRALLERAQKEGKKAEQGKAAEEVENLQNRVRKRELRTVL